jgi:hypothetical protein
MATSTRTASRDPAGTRRRSPRTACVAFDSDSGFGTGGNNGRPDVFLHDRATGATRRSSASTPTAQFYGQCRGAAVSGDGQSVAFHVTVNVGATAKDERLREGTRTGALVCASVGRTASRRRGWQPSSTAFVAFKPTRTAW